jgi:aminopeptidase C
MNTRFILALLISIILAPVYGQRRTVTSTSTSQIETDAYSFTPVVELKATPVKDKARTNTCWCFAATSFIESELLRMGKGEFDLSEMFIIRNNYIDRLKDNYLRRGKGNIDEGGLSHDWMRIFREYGIVPEEIYMGLNYGSATHNHLELQSFIHAVAGVPLEMHNESPEYFKIVDAVLDTYLGKVPDSFTYKGVTYTPKSFAESLGIDPSDYIEITSFTHFPFYSRGVLEVYDNWTMDRFYNVPVDELIEIMDHSLINGYTVDWDGDTSEQGFSHSNGIAVIPETNVTQKMRQEGYENFTTTDDHLMHITGITKDLNGQKFYITKNSWGTGGRNPYGGYLNMSENYVRAKTLFIMVNKNAIPRAIRTKLGI